MHAIVMEASEICLQLKHEKNGMIKATKKICLVKYSLHSQNGEPGSSRT